MSQQEVEEPITVVEVYTYIDTGKWYLHIPYVNMTLEGDQTEQDPLRHQLQSMLEILVILRSLGKDTYRIYTNSVYCRDLIDKWIPRWVEQRFRIPNTEQLRPHHDLIVKLYSFTICMKFELVRHYDDYVYYQQVVSSFKSSEPNTEHKDLSIEQLVES